MEGGLSANLAKTTEIKDIIFRDKLDLFGINETNLNPMVDTKTLNIPLNYEFERCDRPNGSSRGGCGVLISNRVKYRPVSLNITYTDMSKIEAVWIELVEHNVLLCFFYRSQMFTPVDTFLDYMTECMMKLSGKKIIWIGDVNIDQRNIRDLPYRKLDITMKLFGMIQVVTEVTRISYRQGIRTESTIDVVMTNCYNNFVDCKVLDDRIGDHQALKFELNFKVEKTDKFKKVSIRNHSLNNLRALSWYLRDMSDYSQILNCENVDAAVEGFNQHISEAYEKFCPSTVIKCKSNFLYNPSKELLDNIFKKKKLFSKYKKVKKKEEKKKKPNNEKLKRLWEEYKTFKNRSVTNIARRDRKQNIINDLKAKSARNDLTGIWKTIKMASNLPTSCKADNISQMDEEIFNTYFTSVGSKITAEIPTHENDNFLEYMPNNTHLEGLSTFDEVTDECVLNYIHSIANNKSISDSIPVKIYKCIASSIIKPLTHIINISLSRGSMPKLCKQALVTPIYKSEGDKQDPENYRPISILPLLGKCIEYFVNQQLTNYVQDNNILNNQQYGFRKDSSTTFLMLDLFDKIYASKEKGFKPAVIFLDIKKAFDTVKHDNLLEKLKHYGISGTVYNWFKSYLSNRFQCTRWGKRISIALLIICGVPQGSILGPILFSIYINDIINVCKFSVPFLFADDGALYFDNVNRNSFGNIKDEMKLICEWLRINKLSLNAKKTKFMIFDNSDQLDTINITIDEDYTFTIKEQKVRIKKYLGLVLDHKLKFDEHIDYIKKKVGKRIGAMYKSKNLLPLKYRKMFANSLMLPLFDYLDIIWCRATKTKLKELDILYKKTAKIALNYDMQESSVKVYHDMNWLPLDLRRQLHLSTYMYKIINGISPSQFLDKFSYISGGSRDGESCNLYTHKSKSHKRFLYLGAKCWNLLPHPLREAESAKTFSNLYKSKLLDSIKKDSNYIVDNSFDNFYKPPNFK